MTERLVTDLIAIVRRSAAGRPLAAPVAWVGGAPAPPSVLAELEELARRARTLGATDEELGLALGALLAISAARTGKP
jgi:hypothetical protein